MSFENFPNAPDGFSPEDFTIRSSLGWIDSLKAYTSSYCPNRVYINSPWILKISGTVPMSLYAPEYKLYIYRTGGRDSNPVGPVFEAPVGPAGPALWPPGELDEDVGMIEIDRVGVYTVFMQVQASSIFGWKDCDWAQIGVYPELETAPAGCFENGQGQDCYQDWQCDPGQKCINGRCYDVLPPDPDSLPWWQKNDKIILGSLGVLTIGTAGYAIYRNRKGG